MANKNPKVSVVIPTYNEEKDIVDSISSLLKQSYKNIEIIIVDDGSTDNTINIVKKFKKIKIISGQHKGPGYSRNLGSKEAKGQILSFVDADMTFDKNYIKDLVNPIISGKSIGTEERFQKANNLNNIWSKCWGAYVKGYPKSIKKGNVFRAILKSKFIELKGFDPKYGYADDMTFFFKYNLKSDLVDDAVCYHKNPDSLKAVYKQSRWIGSSLVTKWKLFSIPILREILALLLLPLSIIIIPIYALYKTLRRKMPSYIIYFIIFYAARYFGSLFGIYRRLFKGENTK